jgi:hypothetical protein
MTSRFDTPMRRHHVPTLMQRPSIDNQRVTSDFWPPPVRFHELPSHRSITAYTWRPPAPSASCKTWQRLLLHKQVCHESERLTGRGGRGVATGTLHTEPKALPNSSPSKVMFNPDESNLQFLVSFILKASPPWVGVEASLKLSLTLQKSLCAIASHNRSW